MPPLLDVAIHWDFPLPLLLLLLLLRALSLVRRQRLLHALLLCCSSSLLPLQLHQMLLVYQHTSGLGHWHPAPRRGGQDARNIAEGVLRICCYRCCCLLLDVYQQMRM